MCVFVNCAAQNSSMPIAFYCRVIVDWLRDIFFVRMLSVLCGGKDLKLNSIVVSAFTSSSVTAKD